MAKSKTTKRIYSETVAKVRCVNFKTDDILKHAGHLLDPKSDGEDEGGCWLCQDTGEVACPDCEDEASEGCLRCEGTRSVECPECHGSGESQHGLAEIGRGVLGNPEISENPETLLKFRDGLSKKTLKH